jgi:hypothetical protein
MGCDIHLYIEQKKKDKWHEIKVDKRLLPDGRNYDLFAFLAGVRNYEPLKKTPLFPHRGIPDDTSMPKNDTDDFWIGDHSFTYAYLNEILEAPWESVDLECSYFYIFFLYILPRLSSCITFLSDDEKKNIRIIMGFDN